MRRVEGSDGHQPTQYVPLPAEEGTPTGDTDAQPASPIAGTPPTTSIHPIAARERELARKEYSPEELKAMIARCIGSEELIAEHSLLNTEAGTPVIPLSDNMFAGIHGAAIIAGTAHEGGSSSEMLELVTQLFASFSPDNCSLSNEVIERLAELSATLLPEAKDALYELEELRSRPRPEEPLEKIQEMTTRWTSRISKLQPGERLLLPGGYRNQTGGHSMMYLIERGADGEPNRFIVFNTGAGLGHHIRNQSGDLFQLFQAYEGMPFEALHSEAMWQSIMESHLLVNWDETCKASANSIYRAIHATMALYPETRQGVWADDDATPLADQVSGSCFYQVLHPLLCHELDFASHKAVKFELKLHSLVQYYRANKDKLPEDEVKRRLLREALRSTSLSLLKRWDPDNPSSAQLPIERILETAATLEHIAAELDALEPETILAPATLEQTDRIEPKVANAFGYLALLYEASKPEPTVVAAAVEAKNTPSLSEVAPQEAPKTAEELTTYLKQAQKLLIACKEASSEREKSWDPLTQLSEAISRMPLPSGVGESDLWSHLTPEQAEEAIQILGELHMGFHELLSCQESCLTKAPERWLSFDKEKPNLTLERSLTSYQLLITMDKLLRVNSTALGLPQYERFSLPARGFTELMEGSSRYYTRDKEGKRTMMGIRSYLGSLPTATSVVADFDTAIYSIQVLESPELRELIDEPRREAFDKLLESYLTVEKKRPERDRVSEEELLRYLFITRWGDESPFHPTISSIRQSAFLAQSFLFRGSLPPARIFPTTFHVSNGGYTGHRSCVFWGSDNAELQERKKITGEKTAEGMGHTDYDTLGRNVGPWSEVVDGSMGKEEELLLGKKGKLNEIDLDAALLGCKGADSTRIPDTLLLFRKHPELLLDKNWLKRLDGLLFQGSYLLEALDAEPTLMLNLETFCKEAFQYLTEMQLEVNSHSLLAVTRLSLYLERYRPPGVGRAVDYMKRMNELSKMWRDGERGLTEPENDLLRFTRSLCLLEQPSLSTAQWKQLLCDHIVPKVKGGKNEVDFRLEQEVNERFVLRQPELIAAIESAPDEILNHLLSAISPELTAHFKGLKWELHFPVALLGDQLKINLLTGDVASTRGIPSNFLFLGSSIPCLLRDGAGVVHHEKYGSMRFTKRGHRDVVEKLMPNGKWYCFVKKGAEEARSPYVQGMDYQKEQQKIEALLTNGETGLWVCTDPCVATANEGVSAVNRELDAMIYNWSEQRVMATISPHSALDIESLPHDVATIETGASSNRSQSWYKPDQALEGRFIYQGGDLEIRRLSPKGEVVEVLAEWPEGESAPPWLAALRVFGPTRCTIWKHPTRGTVTGVEVSGLYDRNRSNTLRFEPDEAQTSLVWTKDRNFHLMTAVEGEIIPGLETLLVLENEQGDRKVLLPLDKLKKEEGDRTIEVASLKLGYTETSIFTYKNLHSYEVYEVGKDGELLTDRLEGYAHLAYVQLAKKNYLAAWDALEKAALLDQKERDDCDRAITDALETVRDPSPDATAIQLKLASFRLQKDLSEERYVSKEDSFIENCQDEKIRTTYSLQPSDLYKIYKRYRRSLAYGEQKLLLSPEEEKAVLLWLLKQKDDRDSDTSSPIFIHLERELERIEGGLSETPSTTFVRHQPLLTPIGSEPITREWLQKIKPHDLKNLRKSAKEKQPWYLSQEEKSGFLANFQSALERAAISPEEREKLRGEVWATLPYVKPKVVKKGLFSTDRSPAVPVEQAGPLFLLYLIDRWDSDGVPHQPSSWERFSYFKDWIEILHTKMVSDSEWIDSLNRTIPLTDYHLREGGRSRSFSVRNGSVEWTPADRSKEEARVAEELTSEGRRCRTMIEMQNETLLPRPTFVTRTIRSANSAPQLQFPKSEHPVITQELEGLQKSINAGHARNEEKTVVDEIQGLPEWVDQLREGGESCRSLTNQVKSVRSLRSRILKLMNTPPIDPLRKVQYLAERQGGRRTDWTITECQAAYLNGDQEWFAEQTAMNPEQRVLFNEMMTQYLLEFTQLQHQRRLARLGEELIRKESEPLPQDPVEKKQHEMRLEAARGELRNAALQERVVKPDPCNRADRVMLILEKQADIRLRADQKAMIEELLTVDPGSGRERDLICQLRMGLGKSKVILPILATLRADGKRVPFLVTPVGLKDVTYADLHKQARRAFGKRVREISFSRTQPIGGPKERGTITELRGILTNAKKRREIIVCTAPALHNVRLRFIEEVWKEEPDLEALKAYQEVFDLLGEGICMVDEGDLVFDVRKEVNYTFGSPKEIPVEQRHFTIALYRLLSEVMPLGERIPAQEYANYLKDPERNIVERLLAMPELELSREEKMEARAFLAGGEFPEKMETHKADLLALLKEEITSLLPSTLASQVDVRYGRSENKAYAIPYEANNTANERADFANRFETVNYTIQLYLKKGITARQAKNLILQWEKEAAAEAAINRVDISMTSRGKWVEEHFNVSLYTLNAESEKDQEMIQQVYLTQKELVLDFLETEVLPTIQYYSQQIGSYATDLVGLFGVPQAVTGTPWNATAMPARMQAKTDPATEGQIVDKLVADNKPVQVVRSREASAMMEQLLAEQKDFGSNRALMDVAAFFDGQPNVEVAKQLSEFYSAHPRIGVEAILYFEGDHLRCLTLTGETIELSGTNIQPLLDRGFSLGSLFTYYDQRHITGTDIRRERDAGSITTIDDKTPLRSVLQGAFRQRGLLGYQSTHFVLTDMGDKRIRDQVNAADDAPLSVAQVIASTAMVQAERLGEDNYRSLLANLNYFLREAVWNQLRSCRELEEYLALRADPTVQKALIDEEESSLVTRFGRQEKMEEPFAFLREKVIKSLLQQLEQLPFDVPELKQIEDDMHALVSRAENERHLLNRVLTTHHGREVERQSERQKNTRKQKASETERERLNLQDLQQWALFEERFDWSEVALQTSELSSDKVLPSSSLNEAIGGERETNLYSKQLSISYNAARLLAEGQDKAPDLPICKRIKHCLLWKEESETRCLLVDQMDTAALVEKLRAEDFAGREMALVSIDGSLVQMGRGSNGSKLFDSQSDQLLLEAQHFLGEAYFMSRKPYRALYEEWSKKRGEIAHELLMERVRYRDSDRHFASVLCADG